MRHLSRILIIGMLLPYTAFAQKVFEYNSRLTDTDEAAAAVSAGGRTCITGSSFSSQTGWDIVTICLDANADTIWTRKLATDRDEKAVSIAVASNGDVVVGGFCWSAENRWQYLVLKYSAAGDLLWSRTRNRSQSTFDILTDMALLRNDGIVLVGETGTPAGSTAYTVCFDKDGNFLWDDVFRGSVDVRPRAVAASSNLIAIVGSDRVTTPSDIDAHLLLYNSTGTRLAARTIGGGGNQYFSGIRIDDLGNIYIAGYETNAGNSDLLVLRCNGDGTERWRRAQPVGGNSRFRSIALALDHAGEPVVTGRIETGGDMDYHTFKLQAATGSIDWSHSYSGPGSAADTTAPIFAGVTGSVFENDSTLLVAWAAARDERSLPDELVYAVYVSSSPGGQNFSSPAATFTGGWGGSIVVPPGFQTSYVVVRVRDAAGNVHANTREIGIDRPGPPLTITTSALAEATIGTAYADTLTAAGGKPPYQWSIASGTPPRGLQMLPDGRLTGTPDTLGTFVFTVRVRDARNDSALKTLSVTVLDIASLRIVTNSLPNGTAGQDYPGTNVMAEKGTPPYTYTLTGDEPTPNFMNSGGRMSGFLSIPGDYTVEIEVRDSQNRTARKTLVLTVDPPPNYTSAANATLPPGSLWYHNFTVKAGHTVSSQGNLTLNITGKLTVDSTGKLVLPKCDSLSLNLLSRTETPQIFGEIRNRCDSANRVGGDITIRGIGSLQFGSTAPGAKQASVSTSGALFVGDPWYAPRAGEDTMRYAIGGEKDPKVSPVCAIKGNPLTGNGTFPLTVNFDVVYKDPDGGVARVNMIDYGDSALVFNPSAPFGHVYQNPGVYLVSVEVIDDENDTSYASMTLNLRPSVADTVNQEELESSVWAAPLTFSADSLIKPMGIPFTLTSARDTAAGSFEWDFGEDDHPTSATVVQAVQNSGSTRVIYHSTSPDGGTSTAMMTVYVPLSGGITRLNDPPAPKQWFPPLPPAIGPAPPIGEFSHNTDCPDCNLCADPFSAPAPVVVMGAVTLTAGTLDSTAWWLGPFTIGFGFTNASVIVTPGFTFTGIPGAPGSPNRRNGHWGYGIHIGTQSGRLVMCGGTFNLADGGDGLSVANNGCGAYARGGGGGRSSPVWFSSPSGRLSFCGPMTVNLANGGWGGVAIADGDPAAGPCKNGCDARAVAGKGGYGGGGIFYGASQLCYDQDYSISFNAPGGSVSGGDGGWAEATGSDGADCADCGKRGGRGGSATALGGDGGGCSWYFVTSFIPDTSVVNGHLFPSGVFNGGWGDYGYALAGKGGNSTCDGCTGQQARAGNGGNAYAFGGDGGYGGPRGVGGDVFAEAGNGGNATMTPKPPKGGNGCPGSPGCDTKAVGGRGGEVVAARGRGKPSGIRWRRWAGNGGDATATGGEGGDGVGCPKCNGGRGGAATAIAGNRGGWEGGSWAGTATANGGKGGTGSTCCLPPLAGGDGGKGGKAFSFTYRTGINAGAGGNGGNGGDGCPPGTGGAKGTGEGIPTDIPDGTKGADGKDCCPAIKCSFIIPLLQLPIGSIAPGSDRELNTPWGQVRIHFASAAEIFQKTSMTLNPTYTIVSGPGSPTIDVQEGWLEIWQDGLTCTPAVDSAQVDVYQAPVYSSSFNASHQALKHDAPANVAGPHLFIVDSGTEARIAYQVIWSPARFSVIWIRIN